MNRIQFAPGVIDGPHRRALWRKTRRMLRAIGLYLLGDQP